MVSADGIVSYFKKQVGPASVTLAGEEEFQKFVSEKDASVVGESSRSLHFGCFFVVHKLATVSTTVVM